MGKIKVAGNSAARSDNAVLMTRDISSFPGYGHTRNLMQSELDNEQSHKRTRDDLPVDTDVKVQLQTILKATFRGVDASSVDPQVKNKTTKLQNAVKLPLSEQSMLDLLKLSSLPQEGKVFTCQGCKSKRKTFRKCLIGISTTNDGAQVGRIFCTATCAVNSGSEFVHAATENYHEKQLTKARKGMEVLRKSGDKTKASSKENANRMRVEKDMERRAAQLKGIVDLQLLMKNGTLGTVGDVFDHYDRVEVQRRMTDKEFTEHVTNVKDGMKLLYTYNVDAFAKDSTTSAFASRALNDIIRNCGELYIFFASNQLSANPDGFLRELKNIPMQRYGRNTKHAEFALLGSFESAVQAAQGDSSAEALFQQHARKLDSASHQHKCLFDTRYRNGAGQGSFTLEQKTWIEEMTSANLVSRSEAKLIVRKHQVSTRGGDVAVVFWPADAEGATRVTPSKRIVGVDVGKDEKLRFYPKCEEADALIPQNC